MGFCAAWSESSLSAVWVLLLASHKMDTNKQCRRRSDITKYSCLARLCLASYKMDTDKNIDTDQMQQNPASEQGLHGLHLWQFVSSESGHSKSYK